jgi:hypothetical protein
VGDAQAARLADRQDFRQFFHIKGCVVQLGAATSKVWPDRISE